MLRAHSGHSQLPRWACDRVEDVFKGWIASLLSQWTVHSWAFFQTLELPGRVRGSLMCVSAR
jgi:hypothetical protein